MTWAESLDSLLIGQLNFLHHFFEVIAIANGRERLAKLAMREKVSVRHVEMKRKISLFADVKAVVALFYIFQIERPFIVHANTPKASLLSMAAAWLTRVPHRIYTVTGLRFETTRGGFRLLLKTMERLTCFFATKIIPEGEGVKTTLLRERITRKPLEKILNGNINGVDINFYKRTDAIIEKAKQIRNEIKAEADDFIFGFIGRLVRDKGIAELIHVFEDLYRKNHKLRLILVGSFERNLDPLPDDIEKIITTHPGIFAVGHQSDVRPYYAAFDALVFPSHREGFPNVVLQAGAMELPSIVTNISGCNEIIIEGENGVIISPKREDALYLAMERFAEDRHRLFKMASSARQLVADRYEQSAVWAATLEMYNSLE